MQRARFFWPSLAQSLVVLAMFAGCSGQSPLQVKITNPLQRDDRDVLLAGRGCADCSAPGNPGIRPNSAGAGVPILPVAGYGAVAGSGGPQVIGTAGAWSVPPRPSICGDGVINGPIEACDSFNLNGATCASLGYSGGGLLLCNATTCNYDTLQCHMQARDAGPPIATADAGLDDEDASTTAF